MRLRIVIKRFAIFWALVAGCCLEAHAARSAPEIAAFKRESPCPSTGQRRGACPGYVIDHINPLCNGGPDHRSNMQWQTVADAKMKDRQERQLCRNNRRR